MTMLDAWEYKLDPARSAVKNRASLQKALAESASSGRALYIRDGRYGIDNTSGPVIHASDRVGIYGAGASMTLLQFTSPFHDGLFLQPSGSPLGGYDCSAGELVGITVNGNNGARSATGKAGIVNNGHHRLITRGCHVTGVDIGFDMRANCYFSSYDHCTTDTNGGNVGLLLRGANPALGGGIAGSGSDIPIFNCRLAGALAGCWMEQDAGGYHFWNCQFSGGTETLGVAHDELGSLFGGRTYTANTETTAGWTAGATSITVLNGLNLWPSGVIVIGSNEACSYTRSGNTLTVPPLAAGGSLGAPVYQAGGTTSVTCYSCTWEGSGKRWLVRSAWNMPSWSFYRCSMQAITGNDPIGLIKAKASPVQIKLDNTTVVGAFTGADPVYLPEDALSHVKESASNGEATFNGASIDFAAESIMGRTNFQHQFTTWSDVFKVGEVQVFGTTGATSLAKLGPGPTGVIGLKVNDVVKYLPFFDALATGETDSGGSTNSVETYSILLDGDQVVANNVIPPGLFFPSSTVLTHLYLNAGEAPTGAALTVRVRQGANTLGTISLAAGQTASSLTLSTPYDITSGLVVFDVTSIGTGPTGADVMVTLRTDFSVDGSTPPATLTYVDFGTVGNSSADSSVMRALFAYEYAVQVTPTENALTWTPGTTTGNYMQHYFTDTKFVPKQDAGMTGRLTFTSKSTGHTGWFGPVLRVTARDTDDGTYERLSIIRSGSNWIAKLAGDWESGAATGPTVSTLSSTVVRFRFEVQGTTARAKVWADGVSEPGSWGATRTITTRSGGAGVSEDNGANTGPWTLDQVELYAL